MGAMVTFQFMNTVGDIRVLLFNHAVTNCCSYAKFAPRAATVKSGQTRTKQYQVKSKWL